MASCLTKGELNVIPLQFILKTCISEFTNEIVEFRERTLLGHFYLCFVLKVVGQIHEAIL